MTTFPPVPGADVGRPPYGVKYGDQLPAYEYGLTGATGITALQVAIANRNNVRVDIPIIGDSITEGQGATEFTSRWIANANRAIRAAYPTTANGDSGGLGFIPIESTGEGSYTWPVTLASGQSGDFLDLGPVRYCAGFDTNTAVWTWVAPTGTTSVQICYYDGSTPGGFTYQVDSGSVITVDTTGALSDTTTSSITITSGQTLTISATDNGNCFVEGILHYAGDEDSGITLHGCGHYGWCAGTESNGWNQPEAYSLDWAQTYVNSFPNTVAVGIMLGINDGDSGDGNRTAAQFQSDLLGLIGTVRVDGIGSSIPLLLIIEYSPNITLADPNGWPAYALAVRNVAAADGNAHVIDLSYRMPSIGSDWNGGELYADGYHPTDLGHALLGEIASACVRIA